MSSQSPPSRYTVVKRLASGGMADVYLAVYRGAHGFEKQTILKRMRAELADDEHCRRMFIDEARLMSSLSHAHVVGVLDFGEGDDGIFLSLEYVEGLDLEKLLKRHGPLSEALAIYLSSCVLRALAYVHDRRGVDGEPLRIVHRDISPSNVFLGRNGDVKLGDFGVASMARASVQTVPGTIKGKIPYMSPEQAAAEQVDARSDLFSMGVVLFELLTGRRPFSAKSDVELLTRLVDDQAAPDARSVLPGLSPALAVTLQKALAKAPSARFQSADEMVRALIECAAGAPLGPNDIVRLVERYAPPDAPISDPFAAALALGGESSGQPTRETLHERSSAEAALARSGEPTVKNPSEARRGRRRSALVALTLLGVLLGVFATWQLTPPPPLVDRAPTPVRAPEPSLPTEPPPAVAQPLEEAPAPVEIKPVPREVPSPMAAKRRAGNATLDVNSTPWAKVYVDGVFVGETAVTGLVVTAGKHRLRLHNPQVNRTWESTLELKAGEHRLIPLNLEVEGTIQAP